MSGKIVRIIDSNGLFIDKGDYDLQSVFTGDFSNLGVERFEDGIDVTSHRGKDWFPIWFLEDNNVTFVIL